MRIDGSACATIGLAAVLAACWSADRAPGRSNEAATAMEEGLEAERDVAIPAVEARADRALRVGEPLTLRLAPTGELLAAIRDLRPGERIRPTLRLTLVDVETPEVEATLHVFVNHREASAADAREDHPRFVGQVGFYPTTPPPGATAPPETDFLLDVAPTLAELPAEERLVDGRHLDVTLVAVPLRDPSPAADAAEIVVGGVRLSLHEGG